MPAKKSKIQSLLHGNATGLVAPILEEVGFKYLRSKKQFLRKENGFEQFVSLYTALQHFNYNNGSGEILFNFNISSSIGIPAFDQWHLEKTGTAPSFTHHLENITAQVALPFSEFSAGDFDTAGMNEHTFKEKIIYLQEHTGNPNRNVIGINELLADRLPALTRELSRQSDIKVLFEQREFRFSLPHALLLCYGGYTEMAIPTFDDIYQHCIKIIDADMAVAGSTQLSSSIAYFNNLLKTAENIIGKKYDNPFDDPLKVLPAQNNVLEFSPEVIFKEKLRLDITQLDVRSVHMNTAGEILLFANNKQVIKLDVSGKIILNHEIKVPPGYYEFSNVQTGVLKGTDHFYVNNFIVTAGNVIHELPLPVNPSPKKSRHQKNFHILDLAFLNDKYYVLYEQQLLVYNQEWQLEKTIPAEGNSYSRIIPGKEWIVCQHTDKENCLVNFNGEPVGCYEMARGNHRYAWSHSFDYLLSFFYTAKSQLYHLAKGKKHTLWAHPTYIKNYVETMYKDVNHNFGLIEAKFSPDDQYIVGGGDHGKYVAWKLPGLERVELIPQMEFLEKRSPQPYRLEVSGYGESKWIEEQKPVLVNIDGQTFLQNRGNNISNIIFFDNGNVFLTEHRLSNFILSWNRNFTNLHSYETAGTFLLHPDGSLTCKTATELVIYERETVH